MSDKLDHLGQFIMEHFRDVALECAEGLCEGRFDSPGHRRFQEELASLSESDKELLKRTLAYCMDGGLNDFLFHLDAEARKNGRIQLSIDGEDISTLSDGLHKELHGSEGWKEKLSKFEGNTT